MNATSASSRLPPHCIWATRNAASSNPVGAIDLKGIAAALKAAPELERHDAEANACARSSRNRKVGGTPPDLFKFAISSKAGADITNAIGTGLAKNPACGLQDGTDHA